jgi:hypothetical protein
MRNITRKKRLLWGILLVSVFVLVGAWWLLFLPLVPLSLNAALVPTAEYLLENPAPKPEFISFFQSSSFPTDCPIKINLFQYRPTNSPIRDNFTLIIDGVQVQSLPYLLSSEGGPLSCRGQSPDLICLDAITLCVVKAGLNEGLHLAEVSLTDPDGVEHTYSWAFRYDPNSSTSDPNALPTLARLPTETPTP